MLKGKTPIGKRDRKITLMQPVYGASVSGGPNITGYEPLDNDPEPYARVINKAGTDTVQSDQLTHVQQTIFNIRYRTDIDNTTRVVHENKMYAILSYAEAGEIRRSELDITGEYVQEYVIT